MVSEVMSDFSRGQARRSTRGGGVDLKVTSFDPHGVKSAPSTLSGVIIPGRNTAALGESDAGRVKLEDRSRCLLL